MLVATTPCLAEGLNIPEASVVVFLDYDWVPSVMAQAFSRVLRPQQERDVHVHFLTCRGTIEEYMELLCDCKRKAIAEGLDYEEYDFRLEDLPDIKAYAEALVTSPEVLEKLTRRRFVCHLRLQRVLSNLLSNAIKYSPAGGEIRVLVRHISEDGTANAIVSVADQGLGIRAADLPHIFDRFYRGRNVLSLVGGAGIGLSGVKQIVEQHGGSIEVESEEGRGTQVTVVLPSATNISAKRGPTS